MRGRSVLSSHRTTLFLILTGVVLAWGLYGLLERRGPGGDGAPDEVPCWSAEEEIRVGAIDDETYALTRISDLEVDDDGRMFTLHGREALVRVFAPDGTLERVLGGPGDGAGEFDSPARMGWVGDTLWVFDRGANRFTQFGSDGASVGTFSVPFEPSSSFYDPSPPRAFGLLFDGTVHGRRSFGAHVVAAGRVTHDRPFRLGRDGTVLDTLPAIPRGPRQWAVQDPDEPGGPGSYSAQPFGDGPLWSFAPDAGALLVLDRTAPETDEEPTFSLTKISFGGDTLFTRSYPYDPVPVRPERVDSLLDARAAPLSEMGFQGLTEARAREWAEAGLYRPASHPPIEGMVVGRDASIWLQRGPVSDSALWLVLDDRGNPLGEIALPNAFRLLEADGDRIWGSTTGELDMPYLVRYRIEREGEEIR